MLERVSLHEALSQGGTPRERQGAREQLPRGTPGCPPYFQTHLSAPSVPGSARPLTCAHLRSPAHGGYLSQQTGWDLSWRPLN